MRRNHFVRRAVLVAALSQPAFAQAFVHYESPQVHPIACSADGSRLFAVNTPDQRLAVFSLADPTRPVLVREISVGLEPVSVRPRTEDEVWVVNYLSDSISVVSVSRGIVTATIPIKDEPTDVVFAGGKAFVSVSGDDEVRVFDPLTHKLETTIPVFGDEPRNLTVSGDGKRVWAVVHRSGNETTILPENLAPKPPQPTNPRLPNAPQAGLIIHSEDPTYRSLHDVVLPDYDLVEIDVATRAVAKYYPAVGTINFAAAQRPGTEELWVANTEARNLVRFVTAVRGHAVDNRVTRVDTGAAGTVTTFDLNPGIDYAKLPNDAALATALAQPTDVVWDARGESMYVAAFGTDRIGVVDKSGAVVGRIEVGNATGSSVDPRHKRGPRGLALHDGAGVLFVLNRLSNSITGIATASRKVLFEISLPDPTPAPIREGRGFLYDAKLSGNGTFSCAACHVDGDVDGLAWDLGDPGGDMFTVRQPQPIGNQTLHPMKGPMVTQTLRGLRGMAPFHWRGDKSALTDFNNAFDSLMGKTELSAADMASLVTYLESIEMPPNPKQNLDRTLATQDQKDGEQFFRNVVFNGGLKCIDCHSLPTGSNLLVIPSKLLQEPQSMKTAQLRNIYKREGFTKTAQGRKSGFGLTHDGVKENVFDFLGLPVFGSLSTDVVNRNRLRAFVTALDTGTAPAVGYQVTIDAARWSAASATVLLLLDRAAATDIELIVKGTIDGERHGMLFDPVRNQFVLDQQVAAPLSRSALLAKVTSGNALLTVTGVPPGTGRRAAIDRDGDGVLDGDEGVLAYGVGTAGCAGMPVLDAGSEPRVGNAEFSLTGQGAPARAFGILGTGVDQARIPLLGVELLIDVAKPAVYFSLAADPRGELALRLPIPDDATLVGSAFYQQVVWTDACGPQGLSATQGLKVTITR
ncbi:MAG: hypothetical protein KDC87_12520 [Planctomycetes bacterium]|nr:hypothetical protein [Planctomycetota bacterium]